MNERGKFYFFIADYFPGSRRDYSSQAQFVAICRNCACDIREQDARPFLHRVAEHNCGCAKAVELAAIPLREIERIEVSGNVGTIRK